MQASLSTTVCQLQSCPHKCDPLGLVPPTSAMDTGTEGTNLATNRLPHAAILAGYQ